MTQPREPRIGDGGDVSEQPDPIIAALHAERDRLAAIVAEARAVVADAQPKLAAIERALTAYNGGIRRQVSRSGWSRATTPPEKVAEIDALLRSGKRPADVARATGVNINTIDGMRRAGRVYRASKP
jgi:hypothetical protein